MHVKQPELIRIIQLIYERESQSPRKSPNRDTGDHLHVSRSSSNLSKASTLRAGANASKSTKATTNHIEWQDHIFHPITFRLPGIFCDVCQRPCFDLIRPPPALECTKCSFRVHRDHVEMRVKISPCNHATEVTYLRMPNEEVKIQWRKHINLLWERLRTLQKDPDLLKASGLMKLATEYGGVQNIGTVSASRAAISGSRASRVMSMTITRSSNRSSLADV